MAGSDTQRGVTYLKSRLIYSNFKGFLLKKRRKLSKPSEWCLTSLTRMFKWQNSRPVVCVYAELPYREITWSNKAITREGKHGILKLWMRGRCMLVRGHKGSATEDVFNMFSYEKSFLLKIHIQLGLFATWQGKFLQQKQKKVSRRALEKGIANLARSPCTCVQVSHLQGTCWETLILRILFLLERVILEKHLFACRCF